MSCNLLPCQSGHMCCSTQMCFTTTQIETSKTPSLARYSCVMFSRPSARLLRRGSNHTDISQARIRAFHAEPFWQFCTNRYAKKTLSLVRQEPESHFLEKRVSGSKNPHFQSPLQRLEKGAFGAETTFSMCSLAERRGVFDRKLPLPERGEMGVFGPRNPLFQKMGNM